MNYRAEHAPFALSSPHKENALLEGKKRHIYPFIILGRVLF